MNVFEDLNWRGAVYDSTAGAEKLLSTQKVSVYCGFDPTANTLHVGHLVPIMGLVRMQRHGHTPIALVGGGTGMIGDPRADDERPLLPREQIEANAEKFRSQLAHFLDFETGPNAAVMVNNAEWLLPATAIDFLRDVGKHFSVNRMLARHSVRARLEREDGISFTEFSYMLLQAYDYQMLNERYGCKLQIGGSDQWGNLMAGVDLIRRVKGAEVHAIVYPLITDSSGQKFGKSIGGAPALDPEQTSPYRMYQFFLNTEDADVISYLKLFTLLDRAAVAGLEEAVAANPGGREAQRALAREVTAMVHGEPGLRRAQQATDAFFGGGKITDLSVQSLREALDEVPSGTVTAQDIDGGEVSLASVLTTHGGLFPSTAAVRRLVSQKGLKINGQPVEDSLRKVGWDDFIGGEIMVVQQGRRDFKLVEVDRVTRITE